MQSCTDGERERSTRVRGYLEVAVGNRLTVVVAG
jgi:hypothetical protein